MLQLSKYVMGLIIATSVLANEAADLSLIRDSIPIYQNFPKPGVDFHDVGGILKNPVAFRAVIDNFADHYKGKKIDAILALEARGFLFASALAYKLNVPVILLRKPGKLPGATISSTYSKEYGKDTIEMQVDALQPKQRVIIIDDIVATGGTIRAAMQLAAQAQAEVVEVACVLEQTEFANTRDLNAPLYSIVKQ